MPSWHIGELCRHSRIAQKVQQATRQGRLASLNPNAEHFCLAETLQLPTGRKQNKSTPEKSAPSMARKKRHL